MRIEIESLNEGSLIVDSASTITPASDAVIRITTSEMLEGSEGYLLDQRSALELTIAILRNVRI